MQFYDKVKAGGRIKKEGVQGRTRKVRGKSTTDAIFCLKMLLEKWTEGQKAVRCAFIDLEKAYHRVPREELWECLRLAKTSECYIRIIRICMTERHQL